MYPLGGARTGEDPSKQLSHFHLWVGGNKVKVGNLCIRKDKLVREVVCQLVTKGKDRTILSRRIYGNSRTMNLRTGSSGCNKYRTVNIFRTDFMRRKVQDFGILPTARRPQGEVEELRQQVYRWIILRRQLIKTDSTFQTQLGGGGRCMAEYG